MLIALFVACIPVPVPDPDVPTPSPSAPVRVDALGETFLLEPDTVVLTRYPEDVDRLHVSASQDRATLDLYVSHRGGLATGDSFPLGVWGADVADSNGIAFGGLAGASVFALTTGGEGLEPVGTLTIDALDAGLVSLSFQGALFEATDGEPGPETEDVDGEAVDLAFEVDDQR